MKNYEIVIKIFLRNIAIDEISKKIVKCASGDLPCSQCRFFLNYPKRHGCLKNMGREEAIEILINLIKKEDLNRQESFYKILLPEDYSCGIGKSIFGEYKSCDTLDCEMCSFYSSEDCVSSLIMDIVKKDSKDTKASKDKLFFTLKGESLLQDLVDSVPFCMTREGELCRCTKDCINCIFSEFGECVPEKKKEWLKRDNEGDEQPLVILPKEFKKLKLKKDQSYGVVKDELKLCRKIECEDCDFYGSDNCSKALLDWFMNKIK